MVNYCVLILALNTIEDGDFTWNHRSEYGPAQIRVCVGRDHYREVNNGREPRWNAQQGRKYVEEHYDDIVEWRVRWLNDLPEGTPEGVAVRYIGVRWREPYGGPRAAKRYADYSKRLLNLYEDIKRNGE